MCLSAVFDEASDEIVFHPISRASTTPKDDGLELRNAPSGLRRLRRSSDVPPFQQSVPSRPSPIVTRLKSRRTKVHRFRFLASSEEDSVYCKINWLLRLLLSLRSLPSAFRTEMTLLSHRKSYIETVLVWRYRQ